MAVIVVAIVADSYPGRGPEQVFSTQYSVPVLLPIENPVYLSTSYSAVEESPDRHHPDVKGA